MPVLPIEIFGAVSVKAISVFQPLPITSAFCVPAPAVMLLILMPFNVPALTPVAVISSPSSLPPVVIEPVFTMSPSVETEPPADWVMFGI